MKIIVASDDVCLVKQIMNIIDKIDVSVVIEVYKSGNFSEIIDNRIQQVGEVCYFIDIDNMGENIWDLLEKLRGYDFESKIVIISVYHVLEKIMNSRLLIYDYIPKMSDLDRRLKGTLESVLTKKNIETNKINISNSEVPIILNKEQIEGIYKIPNNHISIYYKGGNNNLVISLDKASKEIKEISKNKYYVSKKEINKSKRRKYDDNFKQLLVDLYLIFKIDIKMLADCFSIEVKDIKRWASLVKYNKRRSYFRAIVGRVMLKIYFKR